MLICHLVATMRGSYNTLWCCSRFQQKCYHLMLYRYRRRCLSQLRPEDEFTAASWDPVMWHLTGISASHHFIKDADTLLLFSPLPGYLPYPTFLCYLPCYLDACPAICLALLFHLPCSAACLILFCSLPCRSATCPYRVRWLLSTLLPSPAFALRWLSA